MAIVGAKSDPFAIKLFRIELLKTPEGWRELYRPPASAVEVKVDTLVLSTQVYAEIEPTLRQRIQEELHGLASHQLPVKEGIPLASGNSVDVLIVDSHMVVFEHTASTVDREKVFNTLVFARAGAIAEEREANDAKKYETPYMTTVQMVGWATQGTVTESITAEEDLGAGLARVTKLTSVFKNLGLIPEQ